MKQHNTSSRWGIFLLLLNLFPIPSSLFPLPYSLFPLSSLSAAPLQWVCNWPDASSQTFALYQGETATFEPIFKVNGKAVTNVSIFAVWYQTNGMDQAWWKLDGNVFAPSNDVGAASYRFFVQARAEGDSIYRANGTLRMLPSPGFTPNVVQPPVVSLDFSAIDVSNAPWLLPDATNALNSSLSSLVSLSSQSSTNYTDSAAAALSQRLALASLSATNYTDEATAAATNALNSSLSSLVSRSSQSATNYTDAATALTPVYSEWEIDVTYATPSAPDFYGLVWVPYDGHHDESFGWYVQTSNGRYRVPSDAGSQRENTTRFILSDFGDGFSASFTATRHIIGYTLGSHADKPLASTNAVASAIDRSVAVAAQSASNYTDSAAAALSVDLRRHADMIQAISNESQVVYRLFSSSNVIDEVTNYNSAVNLPTRRLYMLTNTTRSASSYLKIWDESRHHEATLTAATNYAKSAVVDYAAPKGWSATTSGLGAEAPSNTTWISTPATVFAGGLEYAKFVHTGGEVWVLCGNGMMQFDPDTNAYLRISADDGTDIFSIEKTDAVTVGADADSISVDHEDIYIYVRVVSATAPTMYWTTNLLSGATVWHSQSELGQHYDVHWTDLSDYDNVGWKLSVSRRLLFDGGIPFPPSMFFKFSYERPGSTKIVNSAVTDVQGGILCTDGVHKVRPVYNNGSVTWEVITE